MRYILTMILFVMYAYCRENPFVPADGINSDTVSTNLKQNYEPFELEEIVLENRPILLKEIILNYQADDGSEVSQKVSINRSLSPGQEKLFLSSTMQDIQYKLPVIDSNSSSNLMQSDDQNHTINLVEQKSLKQDLKEQQVSKDQNQSDMQICYDKNDENYQTPTQSQIEEQKNSIDLKNQDINDSLKTNVNQMPILRDFKKINFKNLIKFEISDDNINIYTNISLFRNFAYDNKKIVLDFKFNNLLFSTFNKSLNKGSFSKITIGSHDKFIRVVFNLNPMSEYILRNIKGGYKLSLRK